MTVLMCPPPDDEPWPTLGPFVCEFIEDQLCHGPGDLLGKPVVLNDEQRAWIYRMFEVEPREIVTRRGGRIIRSANVRAGRRRFQRCALSLRKGSSKTEFAAWIAAAELHPDGPVRCDGFEKVSGVWQPVPMPVSDPYIPMISYSEEQTEELAYGALRRILQEVAIGNDFDIGLERIMRRDGKGKAEAVSASPNARDGARTTFQHADETHRFTLDSLKRAWTVMLANLAKRPLSDPWALETTTAPAPGEGSVGENTMEYARSVMSGRASNTRLFFYHREAGPDHDIGTREGLKAAITEASGPYIAAWSDIDRIAAAFEEPGADRPYLERVWLNRLVQSTGGAFNVKRWRELQRPEFKVPDGAAICIGFDGSRFDDATALVGVHVESGFEWPLGIWERPLGLPEWEVPVDEVNGIVADAFERWHVCRMYCDPPKWETTVAEWAGRYGEKRVVEWWTNRRKAMAYAIRAFVGALDAGDLTHDGDAQMDDHISNARRQPTNLMDEDEQPLWILRKERPDSPKKIDAAVAAVIAWEARNDAISAGEGAAPAEPAIYFVGGA
jgi:phage terminase large subunit-like protein